MNNCKPKENARAQCIILVSHEACLQRRQLGISLQTLHEGVPYKDPSQLVASDSLFTTSDLNRRKAGEPQVTMAPLGADESRVGAKEQKR